MPSPVFIWRTYMDKEKINREEKLFKEAKKFVEDHIDAFKELAK